MLKRNGVTYLGFQDRAELPRRDRCFFKSYRRPCIPRLCEHDVCVLRTSQPWRTTRRHGLRNASCARRRTQRCAGSNRCGQRRRCPRTRSRKKGRPPRRSPSGKLAGPCTQIINYIIGIMRSYGLRLAVLASSPWDASGWPEGRSSPFEPRCPAVCTPLLRQPRWSNGQLEAGQARATVCGDGLHSPMCCQSCRSPAWTSVEPDGSDWCPNVPPQPKTEAVRTTVLPIGRSLLAAPATAWPWHALCRV